MTPFHCTFNFFYPFVPICEIGPNTLTISHKNEDPSPLQVQKSNRMKYDTQTKWVSSHLAIVRFKTDMTLKISLVSPVFAISLRLTFLQYHLSTEKHNKIACTVSPNQLYQISLPCASMPHKTPFHHSHLDCSILMEVGQIFRYTFSNVSKNHNSSPRDDSNAWICGFTTKY